jgi:hypothetical protein
MAKRNPQEVCDVDVRLLIELANTSFDVESFRRAWERPGAQWDRSDSDRFGFTVPLSKSVLWLDPLGERIIGARLPTWYLYDSEAVSPVQPDREAFDVAFRSLAEHVQAAVGPPALKWRDEDVAGYEAWVWEGSHGLLIAQQAALDQEFGAEVCLAVEGIRLVEVGPTTPFAARQLTRSERLHAAEGFPPLP